MNNRNHRFSDPISFSLAQQETSSISFQKYHLYYSKFKQETFGILIGQYQAMAGRQLLINIHGLILDSSLEIEDIIQTPQ